MRYEWMEDARCAYMGDPEIFFPTNGESIKLREAKEFCMACPVRVECREFAVARPYLWGVWGGLSRLERVEVRRKRRGSVPYVRSEKRYGNALPFV